MKPTVYIETTVVGYLAARPSRDLIVAAHQQLTLEWWEKVRPNVRGVVSPFVIQEASRGDQPAARQRLELISTFPILELDERMRELAQRYILWLSISPSKRKEMRFIWRWPFGTK